MKSPQLSLLRISATLLCLFQSVTTTRPRRPGPRISTQPGPVGNVFPQGTTIELGGCGYTSTQHPCCIVTTLPDRVTQPIVDGPRARLEFRVSRHSGPMRRAGPTDILVQSKLSILVPDRWKSHPTFPFKFDALRSLRPNILCCHTAPTVYMKYVHPSGSSPQSFPLLLHTHPPLEGSFPLFIGYNGRGKEL